MFGNKKKITPEEYESKLESCAKGKAVIRELLDKKDELADDFMEVGKSRLQMDSDINSLVDSIEDTAGKAKFNCQDIVEFKGELEAYRKKLEGGEGAYHRICESLDGQIAEAEKLVEDNKHFTTPSKRLGDVPGELRAQRKGYLSQLQIMGEYSKQMSVLALNAAVEAGRMGDSGRDFVLAADNVRSFSAQYENSTRKLSEDIKASEDYIDELEETIHSLVGLLKDSNLATSKLMRGLQEVSRQVENAPIKDFSREMEPFIERTEKFWAAEAEVMKAGDQNRMTIEDIRSEVNTQVRHLKEIDDCLKNFFQSAGAYCESEM